MAHPLSSITFESLGIKKPEKLISVTSKESIGSALSKMAQYNFLSVPVCSETDPRRFIAAVSGFDVIGLLVKDPQNHILEKPVDRLLTLDSEDESYRVWEVDVQDTLEKTLKKFATGSHRCLVTDSLNRHEPIVLTQTDLLRYIHAHFNELVLGFDPNATLDTWHHLRNDGVVSVTMEATALDAFKLLMEKKLSAVAIVRSDGTLAGTFSHSDLRGMTSKNLSNLSSPVMEYLKHSPCAKKNDSVTCSLKTTFKQVLDLLVKYHAHRVWVVDAEEKPVHVITLSDILAKF